LLIFALLGLALFGLPSAPDAVPPQVELEAAALLNKQFPPAKH